MNAKTVDFDRDGTVTGSEYINRKTVLQKHVSYLGQFLFGGGGGIVWVKFYIPSAHLVVPATVIYEMCATLMV